MAEVTVDPALAAAARLDRGDPPPQRLLVPGADRDVAEPRQRRLGQLQAVAGVVAEAAQEDRLALARLDLHPEHVDEEAQALLRGRRQQLGVADVGKVADGTGHARASKRSRRPSISQERAPSVEAGTLHPLALLALVRGLEHLVDPLRLDHGDAVGVEDDRVALADRRAADLDRLADLTHRPLGGAVHPHPAGPDRQAHLAQLLDVAHRGVDQQRGDAAFARLGRQQVADQGDRARLGHGQDQHLAGLRLRHHRVHHQVVVLGAADGPRRPGDPRAGQHLDQVGVDEAAAAARLIHGRRAQLGQLLPASVLAHLSSSPAPRSASATCERCRRIAASAASASRATIASTIASCSA